MKLSRQLVHELLWTHPTVRVAKALGISGGSLAKSCERRGIPTPPRGYWQRRESGQSMPPIPPLKPVEFELPMPWQLTTEIGALLKRPGGVAGGESDQRSEERDPAQVWTDRQRASDGSSACVAGARESDVDDQTATSAKFEAVHAMSLLARQLRECSDFLDEVVRVARLQPLEVGESMEAWAHEARRACRARDPIAGLVRRATKPGGGLDATESGVVDHS
jgi:hypothetical protein